MKKNNFEINLLENKIHIKYYSKIEDISNKSIMISFIKFKIVIYGESLLISKMDEYEMCIIGRYENIELLYE